MKDHVPLPGAVLFGVSVANVEVCLLFKACDLWSAGDGFPRLSFPTYPHEWTVNGQGQFSASKHWIIPLMFLNTSTSGVIFCNDPAEIASSIRLIEPPTSE